MLKPGWPSGRGAEPPSGVKAQIPGRAGPLITLKRSASPGTLCNPDKSFSTTKNLEASGAVIGTEAIICVSNQVSPQADGKVVESVAQSYRSLISVSAQI